MFVDTDRVNALANAIDAKNEELNDALFNVTSSMKSLQGAWSGAAGEQVLALFNRINEECIEAQRLVIADYANFLRMRIAAGYEYVESTNTSLSDAFK